MGKGCCCDVLHWGDANFRSGNSIVFYYAGNESQCFIYNNLTLMPKEVLGEQKIFGTGYQFPP